MKNPVILLYYKYVSISRPNDLMIQQRAICTELGLKGRILIGQEGINGTLEGGSEGVEKYCSFMNAHSVLSGISWKKSLGTGSAFPKLVVKVRNEIVSSYLGEEDVNPTELTGKYLSAEELHQWFSEKRNFKIVDMRNDYEQEVGHFEGSILSGMSNFRDLKQAVEKLSDLKDEQVITVCTGGVRCEKASGYLLRKGFKNVYQLKDGIVSYMEKYPNSHFKGKLYVFDNRVVMGFETESPESEIIGKCAICSSKSENYVNCFDDECHKHFICCKNCLVDGKAFCNEKCLQKIKMNA
ncbi:MAG: rhodanese-related sulfurtransferase [Candidatus Doudnabacteria bacterium]|nr:rhodanese-related sulfurtransferase [Candidatus Doudnabacteria bacterium]